MYFSNTAILNEVKNEKSSSNRLKHLLVLLTRILAILFMVMAFAQPYFKGANSQNNNEKNISIYIDNSFSMNAEGNGLLLLDEAKEVATAIINSYSENEKFQILSNDFEGKHQRLVNKTEAKHFLNDLKISATSRTSQAVFERQKTNSCYPYFGENNETCKAVFDFTFFELLGASERRLGGEF